MAKDQRLTVRVTAEEKREIERRAAAAGLSLSRFMAESALSDEGTRSEEEREALMKELDNISSQLGSIGGHTNQIACRLNSGKGVPSETIEQAATAVEQAADSVLETMEEIS